MWPAAGAGGEDDSRKQRRAPILRHPTAPRVACKLQRPDGPNGRATCGRGAVPSHPPGACARDRRRSLPTAPGARVARGPRLRCGPGPRPRWIMKRDSRPQRPASGPDSRSVSHPVGPGPHVTLPEGGGGGVSQAAPLAATVAVPWTEHRWAAAGPGAPGAVAWDGRQQGPGAAADLPAAREARAGPAAPATSSHARASLKPTNRWSLGWREESAVAVPWQPPSSDSDGVTARVGDAVVAGCLAPGTRACAPIGRASCTSRRLARRKGQRPAAPVAERTDQHLMCGTNCRVWCVGVRLWDQLPRVVYVYVPLLLQRFALVAVAQYYCTTTPHRKETSAGVRTLSDAGSGYIAAPYRGPAPASLCARSRRVRVCMSCACVDAQIRHSP